MGKKVTIKADVERVTGCCIGCVFDMTGSCGVASAVMVRNGLPACTNGIIYVIKEKK